VRQFLSFSLAWATEAETIESLAWAMAVTAMMIGLASTVSYWEKAKHESDSGCYAPELLSITSRGRRLMPAYRYKCDSGREYEADTLLR